MRARTLAIPASFLIVSIMTAHLIAASAPAPTRIMVKRLHCPVCAKKVAGKLQAVPGVATVQTDIKTSAITVHPAEGQVLAPRALWLAVEQAKITPIRLEGPSGTFAARPE